MASKIVCHAVEQLSPPGDVGAMPRPARQKPREDRQPTFMKEWRLASAYKTQERVSEALEGLTGYKISGGQLSRIERGDQPYTQDLLEALAVVFQCEPSDIIRRRPHDATKIDGIRTDGLEPNQIKLVEDMVAQFRKAS